MLPSTRFFGWQKQNACICATNKFNGQNFFLQKDLQISSLSNTRRHRLFLCCNFVWCVQDKKMARLCPRNGDMQCHESQHNFIFYEELLNTHIVFCRYDSERLLQNGLFLRFELRANFQNKVWDFSFSGLIFIIVLKAFPSHSFFYF